MAESGSQRDEKKVREYLRAKYVDEFYFPLTERNHIDLRKNTDAHGKNEFASEIQKLARCKCHFWVFSPIFIVFLVVLKMCMLFCFFF